MQVADLHREFVAALQRGAALEVHPAGFRLVLQVRDPLHVGLEVHLPEPGGARPGRDPGARVYLPHRVPADEADSGIEPVADLDELGGGAQQVRVVGEAAADQAPVFRRGCLQAVCAVEDARPDALEGPDIAEEQAGVHSDHPVEGAAARTVGEDRAHRRARKEVAPHPGDGEPLRREVAGGGGRHPHEAQGVGALPAGEAAAAEDGDRLAVVGEADAAGEDDVRVAAFPELEVALAFQEDLAFLGKAEGEAAEVDLEVVHLFLREVGVPGEVGGEAGSDPPLQVEAAVGAPGFPLPLGAARQRAQAVRTDLHIASRTDALETGESPEFGRAVPSGVVPDEGPVHLFGLHRDVPFEAHAEDRRFAGRRRTEAERLQRNADFGGPTAGQVLAAGLPDRVPVQVAGARALPVLAHVEEDAVRVRREEDGASPVVVGVEHDRHRVVAGDVLVAEHRSRAMFPGVVQGAVEAEVEVLVVVEDPDDRGLGGGEALPGLAFVEVAHRLGALPGGLVEPAVHRDRLPGRLGADFPGAGLERRHPGLPGHPAQLGGGGRDRLRRRQSQHGGGGPGGRAAASRAVTGLPGFGRVVRGRVRSGLLRGADGLRRAGRSGYAGFAPERGRQEQGGDRQEGEEPREAGSHDRAPGAAAAGAPPDGKVSSGSSGRGRVSAGGAPPRRKPAAISPSQGWMARYNRLRQWKR